VDGTTDLSKASPSMRNPIARSYSLRTLDRIIDVAEAIASDFERNPSVYQKIPEEVAGTLRSLRELTGRQPDWPDRAQREALTGPLRQGLCRVMATLRKTAIEAGEQDPVRAAEAFREAVDKFRLSCHRYEATAIAVQDQLDVIFGRAMRVLGREEVTSRFGLPAVPPTESLAGIFGPEITRLQDAVIDAVLRPELHGRTERFPTLQLVARHGAETISFALSDGDHLGLAMASARNWADALRDLLDGVDIVRAWRDPSYRFSLQVPERDLLPPNPAGEIELEHAALQPRRAGVGVSFDTITVAGEVCCCSGDFCPGNTNGVCPRTLWEYTCQWTQDCMCVLV
jgi:mersacidin/lichenicidin family type 2 lantibiotic